MKTVWVNRFNADGSYKPMSEWVQRECMERYTHTYPLLNDGHGFDGGGLPAHHCFISTFGKIAESGFFYEYIGNQRGDGWLYVADGDLPPPQTDDSAIVNVLFEKQGILQAIPALSLLAHSKRIICWQPILPPKHLD